MSVSLPIYSIFFFNDTATTEIYTLSLHDALPIFAWTWIFDSTFSVINWTLKAAGLLHGWLYWLGDQLITLNVERSEEHTSELQSLAYLVCRLLLEKKKKKNIRTVVVYTADIRGIV